MIIVLHNRGMQDKSSKMVQIRFPLKTGSFVIHLTVNFSLDESIIMPQNSESCQI